MEIHFVQWYRFNRDVWSRHFDDFRQFVEVHLWSGHQCTNRRVSSTTNHSKYTDLFFIRRRNPYIKSVYDLSSLVKDRFSFPPFMNDWIFHLSPSGFRFRRACKTVHDFTRNVIRARKEEKRGLESKGKKTSRKYVDFIDILLNAKVWR